jgi:hypothetical protein
MDDLVQARKEARFAGLPRRIEVLSLVWPGGRAF